MANRTQRQTTRRSFRPTTRQLLIHLSWLLLVIWSCDVNVVPGVMLGNWQYRSSFEGTARYGAAGFTLGNQAFVGTGTNSNNERLTDFWSYDPARNAWSQETAFPGVARSGAVGFAVSNKGYVGLGVDMKGNRLKDFYEYTPSTKSWRRIADFGGTARLGAVAFTIGDKGYIGFGDDLNNATDLWAYRPATNE